MISTLGLNIKTISRRKKLSDRESKKLLVELTDVQKDILVGTLLGDASLELYGRSINARLRFDQTFPNHASYLMNLYSNFYNLAGAGPKVYIRKPDVRTNKVYSSLQFKTLAYPCLNYFYNLFYKDKKKIIPSNISDWLTARALAYWICDDGSLNSYNQTILCTLAYSYEDLIKLSEALSLNFKLRTRLTKFKSDQWGIVIPVKQEVYLRDIVLPYMHYSMLYKIHKK